MKTSMRFLFAMMFVAFATAAFSQVKVIPKAGVNLSGLDAKLKDLRVNAHPGWNAGLDLRLGTGGIFLTPGLHYYNFSADLQETPGEVGGFFFEDQTTIQSLRAPVNLGIRLIGAGPLGLFAKGGVTPAYVLNINEKSEVDFKIDDLNRFTWGANMGLGVDLLFLTADVNYELGLNDFFEGAEGKNNILTFSLGLKF
jgi:hypothetical protein